MRLFFFSLFFFGIFFQVFSQKNDLNQYTTIEDSDPAAKAILEKLRTKYDSYKSIELSFALIIEIPEEDKIVQSGKVAQAGNNYRLDLEDRSIISNGENLWYYLPSNNEVQINSAEDLESEGELLSPQDILHFYDSGKFVYVLVDEYVKDGIVVQQIEFKPLDRDADYHKLKLLLHKKKNEIVSVKAFGKDGSRYTFQMNKLSPNKKFNAQHFVFDASQYPNIHVEDLRID